MSYCRFIEGDVYLFFHVGGYYDCCACLLADKVHTIFTKGSEDSNPDVANFVRDCFDGRGFCENCGGEGCDSCMMHGSTAMETAEEALEHLKKHLEAGHDVPGRAIDRLEEEIASGQTMEREYRAQSVVEGLINMVGGVDEDE